MFGNTSQCFLASLKRTSLVPVAEMASCICEQGCLGHVRVLSKDTWIMPVTLGRARSIFPVVQDKDVLKGIEMGEGRS